jgi:predicted regulator of Ras-like GTPase activity (Roadblock/LC7/MglB family)
MSDLPQLFEEDIQQIQSVITDFLAKSEADGVLLTAQGGFLICHFGKTEHLDITTLAALASNSFEANRAIAGLIGEPNFNSIYQQGENFSMYVQSIDGYNLMVVIFQVSVAVGIIKYYASNARDSVAQIFESARQRSPGEGLDLAMMNLPDSEVIFKRKEGS